MPYGLSTAAVQKHEEASVEVEKCKDKRERTSKQANILA